MSDMLGNLLAFLVSSLFVLRAKQPVGEGGARPMGRKSNSGVGGLSPSFELGKEAARTSPEGVSPLARFFLFLPSNALCFSF